MLTSIVLVICLTRLCHFMECFLILISHLCLVKAIFDCCDLKDKNNEHSRSKDGVKLRCPHN